MEPISSSAIIINDKNDTVFVSKRGLTKKLSLGLWETISDAMEKNETSEDCIE